MAEKGGDVESALREANEAFGRLARVVEAAVEAGATQVDLVDIAREAELEVSEKTLAGLQVDRIIYCHPWLPWYLWFPWRPLWCWWWHRYYPWYRSCPWWWHRCYPGHCC